MHDMSMEKISHSACEDSNCTPMQISNDTSLSNNQPTATTAIIFGAGEYDYTTPTPIIDEHTLVIAADGGYDLALSLGITPAIAIGDFDSTQHNITISQTITLPAHKDDTDMMSAVKLAWSQGIRRMHIYGALGGRIDHTIANIQLITHVAKNGGLAFLHDGDTVITAICDGKLDFVAHDVAEQRMISVFAHTSQAFGVSEEGLLYQIDHVTLSNTIAQGVSNEFIDKTPSRVSVENGILVITYPSEVPLPTHTLFHTLPDNFGTVCLNVSEAYTDRA